MMSFHKSKVRPENAWLFRRENLPLDDFNTVAMNLLSPIFSARFLMLCFLVAASAIAGNGQSSGAFRPLQTAVSLPVADTVSGVALNVMVIRNGNHGDASRTLLSQGGGNVFTYKVNYQPDAGFIGRDTFIVELNYGINFPFIQYQAYQVSVFPSLLQSRPDFAVTPVGSPVILNVLLNDSGSNPPFQVSSVPLTNHGTVAINGNGTVTFSPKPGFAGIAHFNYVVCDALGNCKTESVNVSVTDAQPANDTLRLATAKNTPVTYPLSFAGYSVSQTPQHGTVSLLGGQVFKYQPSASFSGADQFVLSTTNDDGDVVFSLVLVQVLNTPSPNKIAIEDYVFTPKNKSVTFNVRDNDIGNLQVRGVIIPPTGFPGTLNSWQGNGQMQFTPNPGFSGTVKFQYFVGNAMQANIETGTVNIMVGNMNPSQSVFGLTTPIETPLVINYKIPFLGFDFSILDAPDNGSLEIKQGHWTGTVNGQTVSGYNLLIYTPFPGYEGTDEFEMNYCVTQTGQCQSVKIEVEVAGITATNGPYCVGDCVWTGDVNYDGIVNNKDILPLGYFLGMNGDIRTDASLDWYGQFADNWANPFTGYPVDLKHADTDGDGMISTEDTTAVSLFYGQTHSVVPDILPTSKGLPFYLNLLTPPNPGIGDLVEVEVSLGNAANPVANLYGFAYDVKLSPQIVDSAFYMDFYDNSWFTRNAPSLNFQKRPRVGRLETALTRTSGVAASGFGKIGKFSFIIVDDVIIGSKPDGLTNHFSISIDGGQQVLADGSLQAVEPTTIQVPIDRRKNLEPARSVAQNDLFVYPSPASDLVQVHLNGNNKIRQFSILNLMGAEVWNSGEVQWKHSEISVSDLPSGVYFAVAHTEAGRVTKKFEVVR